MKFNNLIPELSVSKFNRSLDFYVKVLGFKVEYERKEDKFALLSFQGSQIMIEEDNNNWVTAKVEYPRGRGINFQIEVKDIKPVLRRLKTSKHNLFQEPKENWYRKNNLLLGNKEFLVQDLDGYLLRFTENLGTKEWKK